MSSMMGNFSGGQASGLGKSGYKQITTQTLSPEQQGLFRQLTSGSKAGIGAGLSQLSNQAGGNLDQSYWDKLEGPAKRQFGELQGGIASRFSGMGSGARRSSGHQNAQSGAATDFAERLQGQRLGLQQSAISQLLGLGNSLLGTKTFENSFAPKQRSFWQELLGSAAGGLGSLGGYGLGNKLLG